MVDVSNTPAVKRLNNPCNLDPILGRFSLFRIRLTGSFYWALSITRLLSGGGENEDKHAAQALKNKSHTLLLLTIHKGSTEQEEPKWTENFLIDSNSEDRSMITRLDVVVKQRSGNDRHQQVLTSWLLGESL